MILVICPLIGPIEDQIKEGQPLGLTCASLQDVNDLFSDNPLPQRLLASAEKAIDNDFKRILKDRSSKVPQQVGLIVSDYLLSCYQIGFHVSFALIIRCFASASRYSTRIEILLYEVSI